jgi:ribosomal protein S18 acetylase RimI-like enzyme
MTRPVFRRDTQVMVEERQMVGSQPLSRQAREADIPRIVHIYVQAYAQPPWFERNEPEPSERYVRWVMQQPRTFCLVAADAEDGVLGFVLAGPRAYEDFVEDWERMAERPDEGWLDIPGALGYVWELAVDPSSQRRGIGSLLLGAAIERLRGEGVDAVVLRSSERAAAAVALYQKFNFQRLPIKERRDPLAGPWLLRLTPPLHPS